MELAIINGTYRDSNTKVAAAAGIVRRTCLTLCAGSHFSGIAEIRRYVDSRNRFFNGRFILSITLSQS